MCVILDVTYRGPAIGSDHLCSCSTFHTVITCWSQRYDRGNDDVF